VSTVITGASRVDQIRENMGALAAVEKLNPEIMARIDEVLGNKPQEED
jgi:aryl-alcohol dehydrogenase-like predicted oxidoreductase